MRKPRHKRSIENPAVPLNSAAAFDYLTSRRSSSGMVINRETILGYPAVFRATSLISQKIASLPVMCYRRNPDGGHEPDKNHKATILLNRRPSSLYTPYTFKATLQSQALLAGNGFAIIFRDDNAQPTELVILNPDNVGIVLDGGNLVYVIPVAGTQRKILPENMLHIKGMSADGLRGYSVVDVLREAFGIGLAAQRYGSVYFRNNASPGPTIIKMPGPALKDKEKIRQFREQWSSIHEGVDNAHKVALLDVASEVQQFQISNETAQFLQTREFEVVQIANILGVPAHKLGVKIATAYNSLESEERAFLNDGLNGWLRSWEEECEAKLLTTQQQNQDTHFIEFNRNQLEQADIKTSTDTLIAKVNNGLLTDNEARSLLNLPSKGPDGDRFKMPSTVMFEEDAEPAGEPPEPEPVQPPQLPPGPAEPSKMAALLTSVLRRFLVRLRKAAKAASSKDDWHHWLDVGLDQHTSILADSLAPVGGNAAGFIAEVRAELAAVTRDQVDTVFDRLDASKWTERILWNADSTQR